MILLLIEFVCRLARANADGNLCCVRLRVDYRVLIRKRDLFRSMVDFYNLLAIRLRSRGISVTQFSLAISCLTEESFYTVDAQFSFLECILAGQLGSGKD